MKIHHLDHLVLTVKDLDTTIKFYREALGMQHEVFGDSRHALKFGEQKINLHVSGKEFEPKADLPTPGSADLCFISETPVQEMVEALHRKGITIEQGPIQRTGATQSILSIYIRDPDGNLIELSNPLD